MIPVEERAPVPRKKTILCVDPSEQVLSVRSFMLETRGYAVRTALSEAEGIKALMGGGIDLVLSSGAEVIREVKALGLLIPAVFVANEAGLQCVEADAVLEKGSQSPVELVSSIRTLIAQFRAERLRTSQ